MKYADPSSIQGTNWHLHQPGDGIWFVESESFKTWLLQKNSNRWLRGIAGAGKSILTSLIVHEVERLRSENVARAYFYCDYKDTATQEPLNVLGSLASRLAVESEKAFKAPKQFLWPLKFSDSNAKLESDLECGEYCSTVTEFLHSVKNVAASNIKALHPDSCGGSVPRAAVDFRGTEWILSHRFHGLKMRTT